MNKKLIELFKECWENCTTAEKVGIHNSYASEHNPDDMIYENDEDFFEIYFEGRPAEAVRSAFFGHYRYADQYVWFNGYANLDTSDFVDDMPIADTEEMAEWFIENYGGLDCCDAMEEFCDACENGFEDDEEEDEDNE